MPNTPLSPLPEDGETVFKLRALALRLMDAADCYEDGQPDDGARLALEITEQVRQLVRPDPS